MPLPDMRACCACGEKTITACMGGVNASDLLAYDRKQRNTVRETCGLCTLAARLFTDEIEGKIKWKYLTTDDLIMLTSSIRLGRTTEIAYAIAVQEPLQKIVDMLLDEVAEPVVMRMIAYNPRWACYIAHHGKDRLSPESLQMLAEVVQSSGEASLRDYFTCFVASGDEALRSIFV